MRMPRGAMPTPRSELAASEPSRPESIAEIFVPSGAFPPFNQELAATPLQGNTRKLSRVADGHLGLRRHHRSAVADEHRGRSLGPKSDNDRQETRQVSAGRTDRCGECLSETGQLGQPRVKQERLTCQTNHRSI